MRQRQFIGKLMRKIDAEPIRAALERRRDADRARLRSERHIEQWRDRLLTDDAAAWHELAARRTRTRAVDELRSLARPGTRGTRTRRARPRPRASCSGDCATLLAASGADFTARVMYNAAVKPLVGIIMGSTSDWETIKPAADTLERLGVPFEVRVVSAHRTPDLLFEYAATARDAASRSSSPAPAAPRTCPA